MCRLFGVIASKPVSSAPWLLDAPIPLLRQATIDARELQGDGWGISWFDGGVSEPRVEKGAEGLQYTSEKEHFVRVARDLRAPLIIAHLRKASNPLGLPREKLIGLENAQPFLADRTIFAHNGWIPHPRETLKELGTRAGRVRGVNDSEVLQQLFLRQIDLSGDPVRAYAAAMERLQVVWEDQGRPPRGPYGGLNLLFAPSARELYAFCYWTGEHGCSLSGLPRPYYEMSYRREPGRVVVVSEPMDRDLGRWRPVRRGEYLHLRAGADGIDVEQQPVPDLPALPELSPSSSAGSARVAIPAG